MLFNFTVHGQPVHGPSSRPRGDAAAAAHAHAAVAHDSQERERVSVPVRACIYLLRRLVQQRRELVILMLQLNQRLLCLHHHLQMTAQRH